MKRTILLFFLYILTICFLNGQDNVLRVFSWDGYVDQAEIKKINGILKEKGYAISVKLIQPNAEGPEQMFRVLRSGKADISFLTLNYIHMQDKKTARLLQAINVNSPRMPNYKLTNPALRNIPFGMDDHGKPLYVPWGGGAYGIWANMKLLKDADLPKSVHELWDPKWKGKLSLTKGQIQPNIALVMMAMGKDPFFLNNAGREALAKAVDPAGDIQKKTNELYQNVGFFWGGGPDFSKKDLVLVSSYGIGASAENRKGGKWKLLPLKEGNTVWLDTINIHKDVTGKKLEAAEIFINYWLGKDVQTRVVNGLGMVAASNDVKNPLLEENPDFFKKGFFWPPWKKQADNVMKKISDRAMKK